MVDGSLGFCLEVVALNLEMERNYDSSGLDKNLDQIGSTEELERGDPLRLVMAEDKMLLLSLMYFCKH